MKRALLVALCLLPLASFAKDGMYDRPERPDPAYYQTYPSFRSFQVRIEQGVRDGSLTRWEARRLQRQLDELRAVRRDYLEDGYLSRPERHDLDRRAQALSEAIYRQRHDGQDRYDYRAYPEPQYRYDYRNAPDRY